MIESSESQSLVCENDILIVDVVSGWEELTYVDWSDSIEQYLIMEMLWDILEVEDDENARSEDDEVDGVENDDVVGADDNDQIKKNAKALYLIMESCGSKRFSLISNSDSAKNAWRALRDAHDDETFCKDFGSRINSGSYSSPLSRKYTCSIILK